MWNKGPITNILLITQQNLWISMDLWNCITKLILGFLVPTVVGIYGGEKRTIWFSYNNMDLCNYTKRFHTQKEDCDWLLGLWHILFRNSGAKTRIIWCSDNNDTHGSFWNWTTKFHTQKEGLNCFWGYGPERSGIWAKQKLRFSGFRTLLRISRWIYLEIIPLFHTKKVRQDPFWDNH